MHIHTPLVNMMPCLCCVTGTRSRGRSGGGGFDPEKLGLSTGNDQEKILKKFYSKMKIMLNLHYFVLMLKFVFVVKIFNHNGDYSMVLLETVIIG